MGYANGIITAPVSIADVQQAVGNSSGDLGTLILNGTINKFARYKPVKYPTVGLITDANRQSVGHGIILPDTLVVSAMDASNVADAAANDWGYDRPAGGLSSPYRLADFADYDVNAVPPIQACYPKDGWTVSRGKQLSVKFDLDPSDSYYNLQSYDLLAGALDLNACKFVGVLVDYNGNQLQLSTSEFILDSGELQGDTLLFNFANRSAAWYSLYICIYRLVDNRYELIPLPKQGSYNPAEFKVRCTDDAEAEGGGIGGSTTEEMFNNVFFSSTLNGDYKTAWVSTDAGTGEYCLVSQGSLYVKMNITNGSNAAKTINRSDFVMNIENNDESPSTMYNSSKSAVSSITIAAGATETIYLFFDDLFSAVGSYEWDSSNKNSSWSLDFTREGLTLFGCDIYAMKGLDGWVSRKS